MVIAIVVRQGDCGSDASYQQCPLSWVGNGVCDAPCNNEENDYDYPDCTPSVRLFGTQIPFCPPTWRGATAPKRPSIPLLTQRSQLAHPACTATDAQCSGLGLSRGRSKH